MVRRQHRFKTLSSTNTIGYELAQAGAAHGTIIRAETQTAGRGRLGKVWLSPPGKGLYFSMIIRPRLEPEEFPKLAMTAGLAIAKAIERTWAKAVLLKWPNDIYLSGKKCGGVLCEASLSPTSAIGRFAVIGVGLNVLTRRTEFPEHLQNSATSIAMETDAHCDPEQLLATLIPSILAEIAVHEQDGFAPILDQWQQRDFLKGKVLSWLSHSGEVILGRSEGPDEHGRLMVRDQNNLLHEVLSGDISLAHEH